MPWKADGEERARALLWLLWVCSTKYLATFVLTSLSAETPWIAEMTPSPARASDEGINANRTDNINPPAIAAFSPAQATALPATKQRSTILVHQNSPFLVATPPAVTRALAFSHPFVLPLNRAVGLVTWTTGDPWESFLLVAGFWAVTLYGDIIIRYAGPMFIVMALILGMYSRRYSPLSSSGWTGEKLQDHKREASEGGMKHQKSLEEIVDTLNVFTSRCNVLLEPFMQLTDYLSTQRTATSATTRPALTSLFIRILFVTPVWIGLTFPPFYLLTTRRVVVAIGTVALSWHSRPARVTRTLLWRSKLVRHVSSSITSLDFSTSQQPGKQIASQSTGLPPRIKSQRDVASSLSTVGQSSAPGVRFTFVVYENQRRWLGLGWTYSLLTYERASWTDEHLNPSDSKENFQLPEVENGTAKWHWVQGVEWQVDGGGKGKLNSGSDGWIYYDNKWNDGRRGQDGWGRYTRRRKWYRDAELVDTSQETNLDGSTDTIRAASTPSRSTGASLHKSTPSKDGDDSSSSQTKRRGFFKRRGSGRSAQSSSDFSGTTTVANEDNDDHILPPHHQQSDDWGVGGDDVKMGLG